MIVVDTNVWSEMTRTRPAAAVEGWLRAHHDELALTSVTIGELLFGLELLSEGRRREELTSHVESLIRGAHDRTLHYDTAAARRCASIRAARRRAGRELAHPEDAMIAAIAALHDAPVATRNVTDFEEMGVTVIDPWEFRGSAH